MHNSFPLNSLSALYKELRNIRWIAHISDRRNHYHSPGSIYMTSSFMQAAGGWGFLPLGDFSVRNTKCQKGWKLWKGDICDEKCEVDTLSFKIECYSVQLDNEIDVVLCRYYKVLSDTKPYQ